MAQRARWWDGVTSALRDARRGSVRARRDSVGAGRGTLGEAGSYSTPVRYDALLGSSLPSSLPSLLGRFVFTDGGPVLFLLIISFFSRWPWSRRWPG